MMGGGSKRRVGGENEGRGSKRRETMCWGSKQCEMTCWG
jgi:hypothetical protein